MPLKNHHSKKRFSVQCMTVIGSTSSTYLMQHPPHFLRLPMRTVQYPPSRDITGSGARLFKPQLEFLSLSALKPSRYTNANAFDSPRFGLRPTRSDSMRLVALSGLLICSLAASLHAAGNDADRF